MDWISFWYVHMNPNFGKLPFVRTTSIMSSSYLAHLQGFTKKNNTKIQRWIFLGDCISCLQMNFSTDWWVKQQKTYVLRSSYFTSSAWADLGIIGIGNRLLCRHANTFTMVILFQISAHYYLDNDLFIIWTRLSFQKWQFVDTTVFQWCLTTVNQL